MKKFEYQLLTEPDLLQRSDRKATQGLAGDERTRAPDHADRSRGDRGLRWPPTSPTSTTRARSRPARSRATPAAQVQKSQVLRARRRAGGADGPDRLHRDPRLAAGARKRENRGSSPWPSTVGGFGFSVYLTYREVFTLQKICEWCVGSAMLMTIMMLPLDVAIPARRHRLPPRLPPRPAARGVELGHLHPRAA